MSPTVFKNGNYRYYFFSREENRVHIHIISPDGEAKVWLEPEIDLAMSKGLSDMEINKILKTVREFKEDIYAKWNKHFRS
jgi:hypothetical protein